MRNALLALLAASCAAPPADLLLRDGRLPGEEQPTALAIRDGRIAWLGPDAEATAWQRRGTVTLDLDGGTLLPGFWDSHLHLEGLAEQARTLDLVGTTSLDEVVARAAALAAERSAGTWILGRGWDQNDWAGWPAGRMPDAAALSAAVPGHPVALERVDGHALLLNDAALRAAGIGATTAAPDGGRIESGVLIDKAMALATAAIPPPDEDEAREGLRQAVGRLHAEGVTAVVDAGVEPAALARLVELARAGELPLRVFVLREPDEALRHDETAFPRVGDTLATIGVKLVADGALGSRGAWLLEPYSDAPGNTGLSVTPPDEIQRWAEWCLRHGRVLAVHAIGDRANREVLDAFERALAAVPAAERRGLLRIEHAQVLHPDDVPRFAELGVVPSMQALHCTSDMPWATDRLGPERVRGAYAWRSLLDTGVTIPGGTDAPVERPSPLASLRAAVTRDGYSPEQVMTRAEALASLTSWAAAGVGRAEDLGRLALGARADLVVLSADPLTAPLEELAVVATIVAGELVFDARR